MSDVPEAPGWWQASDGRWYAPEQFGVTAPPPPSPPPPSPPQMVAAPPPPGAVQVSVQGPGFFHATSLPVTSPGQVADVESRVNYIRGLVAQLG